MVLGLAVLFITGCSHERQITVKDKDGNVIAGVSESEEPVFDSEEEWLAYMTKDRSNYITVKGENTIIFWGELDKEKQRGNSGDIVIGTVATIEDGIYQNTMSDQWTIEDIYTVIKCEEEYYMMYYEAIGEKRNVTDNLGGEFKGLKDSEYITNMKYIDCPIKDYEFYVDGKKLNMQMVE